MQKKWTLNPNSSSEKKCSDQCIFCICPAFFLHLFCILILAIKKDLHLSCIFCILILPIKWICICFAFLLHPDFWGVHFSVAFALHFFAFISFFMFPRKRHSPTTQPWSLEEALPAAWRFGDTCGPVPPSFRPGCKGAAG